MKLSVVRHNTQKGVVRRKLCRFSSKLSPEVLSFVRCLSKVLCEKEVERKKEVERRKKKEESRKKKVEGRRKK